MDSIVVDDSVWLFPTCSTMDNQTPYVKDGISLHPKQSSLDKTSRRTCDVIVDGELVNE